MVVNCFQFSIFAFAKTTATNEATDSRKLWIAFNLVSLHLQKQPYLDFSLAADVVNCFQFSIFAFAKTTLSAWIVTDKQLWIAFNLVSLHLQKQPHLTISMNENVVNCFQFSIFAFAKTTLFQLKKLSWRCELLSI